MPWQPISSFDIEVDLTALDRLHDQARLAIEDYNLGNNGDWYGHFRNGEEGVKARVFGVAKHYTNIHAWRPVERDTTEMDYQLASILFAMDSAIECFVFMLNALGWTVSPSDFCDVTDDRKLRDIRPSNIIKGTVPGYATLFPSVVALWKAQSDLIEFITVQHDVSKHRSATILGGGERRNDAPDGFYAKLGIEDDGFEQQAYSPPMEVYLEAGVKTPNAVRAAGRGVTIYRLEDLVPLFATFMKDSAEVAAQDAIANVPINDNRFGLRC